MHERFRGELLTMGRDAIEIQLHLPFHFQSVCRSVCLSVQVLFNLANQYAANDMDNEALNTYNVIIKTKDFNNSGKSLLLSSNSSNAPN